MIKAYFILSRTRYDLWLARLIPLPSWVDPQYGHDIARYCGKFLGNGALQIIAVWEHLASSIRRHFHTEHLSRSLLNQSDILF